jgi:hypothetical protein
MQRPTLAWFAERCQDAMSGEPAIRIVVVDDHEMFL